MSSGLSVLHCFSLFKITVELSSPKIGIANNVTCQLEMTAENN